MADKGSDVQLMSWIVEEFTQKGDNYACLVFSIAVSYRQGSSLKDVIYVAKCNPRRQFTDFKKFVRNQFMKEAGFFEHLAPLLNAKMASVGHEPLRIPTCFFTSLVEDEEVIILNDLRREGFKMVDRKKGLDVAHATLVLREMGRLHAASVLVQSKLSESLDTKNNFLIKDMSDSETFNTFMETVTTTLSKMMEEIGGYQKLVTWTREFAKKSSKAYRDLKKRRAPFDVLCHGDCWVSNLLFRYNERGVPADVTLLDFQQCCLASPGIDLNFLLYTSFDGVSRRDNLHSFLKAYYESFSEVLQASGIPVPYSSEELLQEYRRKNLFGFLIGTYVVPMAVCDAEDVADMGEAQDGCFEVFLKSNEEKSMRQLKNNPILKPRLISLFDDLIEHSIIY